MSETHRIITTPAALTSLIDEIREAFEADPRWALDTEFMRERSYYPKLALVQVAWAGGLALIDPLEVDVAPLGQLMEAPLTVVHAAEQDLQILESVCGRGPARLFDPQVAGAFLGFGTTSLGALAREVLGVQLAKGNQLADWIRRPLDAEALRYAAADVEHLLALEEALGVRLDAAGRRSWAEEECEQLRTRERGLPDPDTTWWKLKGKGKLSRRGRGVAQALCAWREREARRRDRPVRSMLSDMAILAMAGRPPKTMKQLQRVRGFDRNVGSERAEAILGVLAEGEALGEGVRMPPVGPGDRAASGPVAVLLAWAGEVARRSELDVAVLATREDVANLVRGRASRLDGGWRYELAGADMRRLLAGSARMAIEGETLTLHANT